MSTHSVLAAPQQLPPVKEPTGDSSSSESRDALSKGSELRFNFQSAAWKDVLEWLAQQADLSLQLDLVPPGTFNYTDSHSHTPTEAIDLVNGVLLTKGYTLLRRGRLLTVLNFADLTVPSVLIELVPVVPLDELDDRGQFELTQCRFQLEHVTADEVERELRSLIGPHGTILAIPAARQVLIVETGGKLRLIREVIEAMERQKDSGQPEDRQLRGHPISTADPTTVLSVMQTMLAGEPGVRLAIDPKTGSLIALASPTHHLTIKATLEELQRGDSQEHRIRVFRTSRDIDAALEAALTLWTRENNIRFVTPSAERSSLREVSPSRSPSDAEQNDDKASWRQELRTPRESGTSTTKSRRRLARPSSPDNRECPDNAPNGELRTIPAPLGPVRIVHVKGTDLFLIRAGSGVR